MWLKNSNGETRPLCLKLEISNRVPKKFIPADLQKEGDTGFLELLRIDLIPFSDGECFRAWLRFVFSVAPTTIGSYLTWACQRKFEKSLQVDHRSGQKIKLEKLANSIISAFINHQDPWQEETPKAEALIHSWQMIQALLVSYAPKKLFLEDPAWETGIYLLAGLHNPRTISDDKLASFKPVFWQHADSQNTVFAFDKHGLSVFADAQDGFNRSYKPSIITAAYGLFWLLSIYWQGSSLGRASLEAFTEAQEERVRAAFLKALCAWRLKTG
ncbi:MAG: hypothetical protein ONB05_08420 [candidate division KSB1 bacterium]|nr:hypothetical protein [candidate division KSB1 bacterium]